MSVTFDAGGLIALERSDRRVLPLLARARDFGIPITIPTTALAQVMRNPSRQARLSRLIRQASTNLVPLDGPDATAVGYCWHEPELPGHCRLVLTSRPHDYRNRFDESAWQHLNGVA